MRITIITIWVLLLTPVNAFAEKLETNVDNVFIKNISCLNSNLLKFNVSNKSTKKIGASLVITVFDEDDDPIDNYTRYVELRPVSGDGYTLKLSCSDKYNFAFKFE